MSIVTNKVQYAEKLFFICAAMGNIVTNKACVVKQQVAAATKAPRTDYPKLTIKVFHSM